MATSYRKFSVGAVLICGMALASAGWPEDRQAQKPPPGSPQPKVSIEPRARPASETANERRSNIRVDSTLVLINATVVDPMNRFVTGLEKEHFRLFEEKAEQKLTHFASEDAPLSIGLVFMFRSFS